MSHFANKADSNIPLHLSIRSSLRHHQRLTVKQWIHTTSPEFLSTKRNAGRTSGLVCMIDVHQAIAPYSIKGQLDYATFV